MTENSEITHLDGTLMDGCLCCLAVGSAEILHESINLQGQVQKPVKTCSRLFSPWRGQNPSLSLSLDSGVGSCKRVGLGGSLVSSHQPDFVRSVCASESSQSHAAV